MKPTTTVAETLAPDGARFVLYEHDGEYYLYMNQRQVMSTRLTQSELLLSDVGCRFRDSRKNPRVLIGGLGLGFSLRRALEISGPKSRIEVAELLPEIVRWNRELLGGRNDDILADSRSVIIEDDVYECIRSAASGKSKYDAILLDVDDGPSSLIQPQNTQLYQSQGLDTLNRALTPGGRIAFWAAEAEPRLLRSLRRAGYHAEEIEVGAYPNAKRRQHRVYLAERRD